MQKLATRLRLPIWAYFLLAVVCFSAYWILGRETLLHGVVLIAALIAAGFYGAFSRRGAETELTAEIELRKEAEQEARNANRVKSEFLANMSHELRTPLNAIIGSADLLRGAELSSEDRRHVEVIDNSAESLLALNEDILDFAKLEAGRLRLETTDFILRDLVEGVRSMVAPAAAEKNLELTVDVESKLPEALRGDPSRLRQILLNLAGNAVKFTPQGEVRIRVLEATAEDDKPRIRFTVSDTGIGISSADQQRIFETFYQSESMSARRFSGSGLGLSISKELIRRMGGEFGLESERGVGSTFWVELPLVPALEIPAEKEQAVSEAIDRGRFRILIVDDEPINRRLALAHLKALGYRAAAAEDGPTALAVQSESFDAVLLDCQMATVDGYETARRWRRAEKEQGAARTPIIALTARALPGEREKCVAVGMDDYLTKPYRGDDLKRVLDRRIHTGKEDEIAEPAPKSSFEERISALRRLGEATGEDILGPAIESFTDEAAQRVAEMRTALDSGDPESLALSAHGFISVSGALGADRLVELLKRVEARAVEGDLDGSAESIDEVEEAAERFNERLRALKI